ncbi:hypothetical protein ABEY43_06630 [Priestia megaterium]
MKTVKASKIIRKINLLVAVINDSAATENEKSVSQKKIVGYSRELIAQAGFDLKDMNTWHVSGIMRLLFERKSVLMNTHRESEEINIIHKVLRFHNINVRVNEGSSWSHRIIL